MELQINNLDRSVIGKRLGQKLYSPTGSLLLGMGAEIREFHFSKIQEVGYRSMYILKDQADDVINSGGHLLTEKTRASAPITLKSIFKRMLSKDKIEISNAKKDLSILTDTLINEVNMRRTEPPDILDLKREKDYLYQHAMNVAAIAILIGQSMQYHQLKLFDLALSALLSDFGMLFIDEAILFKPEALDEEETEKMQKHTIMAFQHLGRNCFVKGLVTVVALQHHERWDGSGYLKSLVAEDIHEYSRIVALADFFDAYTSDRPYRSLYSIDEAITYIKENDGVEFDPNVVRHLLRYFE
jgi:HD-GYP domain-containing protein (c-di-GMP phosphodiesterase class II)